MHIYCDESGGVGRGVMTVAAVAIEPDTASALIARFRTDASISGEVKGSRIDLKERAWFLKLFADSGARAHVAIALSAVRPDVGADRGNHDIAIYAKLLEAAIDPLLLASGGCAEIIIDDGRYGPATLSAIRDDVAAMLGPCGRAALVESHHLAGLQIADVIANSFFNRALPSERQEHMAAQVQPLLDGGQVHMSILPDEG
jgi:Protein of unknown function (DUF3800)